MTIVMIVMIVKVAVAKVVGGRDGERGSVYNNI